MKSIQCLLSRIFQSGATACYEFDTNLVSFAGAGQFLLAKRETDFLPVPLFPSGPRGIFFTGGSACRTDWQPGDLFFIRYPLGKGFSLPDTCRRLLILSATDSPLRLLPVSQRILDMGGEVALCSSNVPIEIPSEIELLTLDQVADAVVWADAIIGDVSLDRLSDWEKLVSGDLARARIITQLLVDTPILCTGQAECGICSVKTRRGWKHACSDGPVFDLKDLET